MRNHKMSQHFLRSPKLALILIGHSNIRKNNIVLDIGAGSGVITFALSKRAKQVISIEKDLATFRKLQSNTKNITNITAIHADIINFDLNYLPEGYKICANPPFAISSAIISKILDTENQPQSAYLILQKQFARKIIPSSNHFTSSLGIELFPFFTLRIRRPLRKTDFTPPPNVDTVFVELKRREKTLINAKYKNLYRHFVRDCFNSQTFFKKYSPKNERMKPSELSPEKFIEMFKYYQETYEKN